MATLFDEIGALLVAEDCDDLARLEHTLTDGYARSLSLEGERWRIEKRIGEVAGTIGSGGVGGHAQELSALAQRLAGTDDELMRLRGALVDLRRRAGAVRAASS